MSNLLNSHEFGLSKALSGYKLPCITYVLFSSSLLLPAHGADREEAVDTGHHHRMWQLTHTHTQTTILHAHILSVCVCAHMHILHTHTRCENQ